MNTGILHSPRVTDVAMRHHLFLVDVDPTSMFDSKLSGAGSRVISADGTVTAEPVLHSGGSAKLKGSGIRYVVTAVPAPAVGHVPFTNTVEQIMSR